MKLNYFWFATIFLLLAISCTSDKSKKIPDVSQIEIDWSLVRYEGEMLSLDTTGSQINTSSLFDRFPVLSLLYFREILGFDVPVDSLPVVAAELIQQPVYRHWLDTCNTVFGDFSPYEEDLQKSFKLLKYYFPAKEAPRVYTLVSEFSVGNFIFLDHDGRDAVGIGLDFFLGPDFPYITMASEFPAFSSYLSRSFTPEHMVRKTMAVVVDDLTGDLPPSNLLDAMIHEGKKMYILEKLIPYEHDTILWEFTNDQWNWVTENEGQIWRHFIQQDLLYNTDRTMIQKLTLASPNSPGMPVEAPGRTAVYTGYQIVKSFHRRNPEMDITDLLQIKDAQEWLKGSKYRPG